MLMVSLLVINSDKNAVQYTFWGFTFGCCFVVKSPVICILIRNLIKSFFKLHKKLLLNCQVIFSWLYFSITRPVYYLQK